MLIKKQTGIEIPSSEITPEHIYRSRRKFMKGAATASVAAFLAACGPRGAAVNAPRASAPINENELGNLESGTVGATTDELGDELTPFEDVVSYNNYYEFGTDKFSPARLASDYPTSPWQVEVTGMVNNPGVYDVADMTQKFDQEERIYRLRCVEAWSMVIPWIGFPLHKLLKEADPTSNAQFVRFQTVHDPDRMPGQRTSYFDWPYVEGLRLDEAMHDLTLLATGLYGKDLLMQNGAPIRLVVPWKYGFKSIKSIIKIELTDYMPTSLWMAAAPNEYGFYANVNPNVPHPRWSQSTERRIGELGRRETLLFNGYAEQVAELYAGEDLETMDTTNG